ncbi:MAG: TonB-dependent siderophore receptor [Gammaproteobacteria bacterium]
MKKFISKCALFLMSAAFAGTSPQLAQARAASASAESTREFNLPVQPLSVALRNFAELTGMQLAYSSALVKDLDSAGLKGSYKTTDALRQLLTGTGLTFRIGRDNTVVIEKAVDGGARVLGHVRVEGATGSAVAGVNGSKDSTATEGSGSYTSSALSIASKTPQSMKETPQSVSVITQQRMQEQNLTDFNAVMAQATGVTVVPDSTVGNLNPTFYSRGFAIRRIQIDGGVPLSTDTAYGYYPAQLNMAMYDHVEILRGADGLFGGYGSPGAAVNLARKRPLDHGQVVVDALSGSWNNTRATIDVTAPLGFDGRLRGRAVVSYQDQDYFYDVATTNSILAYAIAEMDLAPDSTLSAGFSLSRQNSVPGDGLPRYESGEDLHLSRSTCLCVPWARWNYDSKEVFAQFEQHFGDRWSAKLNVSRVDQDRDLKYIFVSGPVNPTTLAGPVIYGAIAPRGTLQKLVDFSVNGRFDLFGHEQQILVGGSYQNVDDDGTYVTYSAAGAFGFAGVDVFHFNPSNPAYGEPKTPPPSTAYPEYGQKQMLAYATVRLTPLERLHFITGLRYGEFESITVTQNLGPTGAVLPNSPAATRWKGHNLSWPPTYSAVYDASKTVSVYASYTDIYQSQATRVRESGDPIDPLTGSNVEVGAKLESADGKLNASLSAYRIEQKNYPLSLGYGPYASTRGRLPDGIHTCCYSNDSNQVNLSRGVDAEVTGEVLPALQLSAGYTYNLNQYKGTDYGSQEGTPLVSRAPKHLFKLWTGYRFSRSEWLKGLDVGGGLNAQTKSFNRGSACTAYNYTTDAQGNPTSICKPGANVPYNYIQSFYAVFSARAAYRFNERWTAALNVNNLTDRVYYQATGSSSDGNQYGEPRNFMLTLRGNF